MADDHFLQNIKQTFSLSDIDPSIDLLNYFPVPNPYFDSLIEFPNDKNFFPPLSEGPGNLENFPGLFIIPDGIAAVNSFTEHVNLNDSDHKDRKREAIVISTSKISSANTSTHSSPQVYDNGIKKTNRIGRGKKVKCNEEEDEKRREVVHVRAKRGQATDSHSLAERVRRRKINERLQCLQDIVPGCHHKTMGMAVMLDEIINYVQSLQSQVQFLSMRLTAAGQLNGFNSDTEAMETIQRAKTFEVLNFQNIANQGLPFAEYSPLGLKFGCCPQLPDNS